MYLFRTSNPETCMQNGRECQQHEKAWQTASALVVRRDEPVGHKLPNSRSASTRQAALRRSHFELR
jgi:hypothetical protein